MSCSSRAVSSMINLSVMRTRVNIIIIILIIINGFITVICNFALNWMSPFLNETNPRACCFYDLQIPVERCNYFIHRVVLGWKPHALIGEA